MALNPIIARGVTPIDVSGTLADIAQMRQRDRVYAADDRRNALYEQKYQAEQQAAMEQRQQQVSERDLRDRYAEMVAIDSAPPEYKAQWVQMQAQKHPEFAQTPFAQMPPEQAFAGMKRGIEARLGIKPEAQSIGSVVKMADGTYATPSQAVGQPFWQEPRRAAAPKGATSSGGPQPPSEPRFRRLTAQEATDAGYPAGAVVQRDTQTGEDKVVSKQPPANASVQAKVGAVRTLNYVLNRFSQQLPNVETGGPMGVRGYVSRAFDSQDTMRFDNLREQLSTELRTIFRIPGEGALSDREQAQYGLQLPDVRYSRKNNLQIIEDLRQRAKLRMQAPDAADAPQEDVIDLPSR